MRAAGAKLYTILIRNPPPLRVMIKEIYGIGDERYE
jgi:hypothetical protein